MKKILFLCTKISINDKDTYLTNDLINEFVKRGYLVTVIAFGDVNVNKQSLIVKNNLTIHCFPTTSNKKVFKYFFQWPKAIIHVLSKRKYFLKQDYIVAFAPLSVVAPLLLMIINKHAKKICILFDFFPLHQIQVEVFSQRFEYLFKRIEVYLLNKFDVVTGMSDSNVRKIKNYYKLDKNVKVEKLYLWSSNLLSDKANVIRNRSDYLDLIFGGQLIPGRDIESLIDLVIKFNIEMNFKVRLTIFSTGQYFIELKKKYSQFQQLIIFKNRIPREDYSKVLTRFDIGVIVTDPRVTFPTFPSKILDYISAGLPVLCIIEQESDIAEVINNSQIIHINNFDFNQNKIEQILSFFKYIKENHLEVTLDSKFSVGKAVNKILEF